MGALGRTPGRDSDRTLTPSSGTLPGPVGVRDVPALGTSRDRGNKRIQVFDLDGKFLRTFGE